ncbi:MAG: hypothetical protein V3S49_02955 [Thermodesulfobacteriota bacterium]
MTLQMMSQTDTMRLVRGLCLIMLVCGLLLSPGYADEIIFKDDKGVQTGTVIGEDEKTVTIRFPRKSIKSIVSGQEEAATVEKNRYLKSVSPINAQFQERLERLQQRIELLERNYEEDKKAGVSPTPDPSKNVAAIEQLLQEEMGRVEGIILWKKKPLVNGSVKIVLERYTGFSLASLKKMFSGNREKSSDQIILETKTNTQGQYVFEKVPPGQYRLYWMPDAETGWVHRMREKPDFEVISGKLTVQNIPRMKK